MNNPQNKDFWDSRYIDETTGWDLGTVSTPIKEYVDQLEDKTVSILIPGAGNSHEAEYLHDLGFINVSVIDISKHPLDNIVKRVPSFPTKNLIHDDFFNHDGEYDIIIEQTFFCALNPSFRVAYVNKMHDLLKPNGKIIGLMFNDVLNEDRPPFGGNPEEYRNLFSSKFEIKTMKTAHNSVESRVGRELFINFRKFNYFSLWIFKFKLKCQIQM